MERCAMSKKIALVFATTAGDVKESFPLSEHLYVVKQAVMKRLELDPHKVDEFVVTLNGKPLDQGETLEQLGLADGTVLIIERHEVKIALTFVTATGQVKESFPVDAHLHIVKQAVMKRLELDPHKVDEFVVTLNGNTLDQGETLEQLRLTDGTVLTLERREVMVRLIIATTAGDLEESFPVNEHLHTVKHSVMKRLNLDSSKADEFVVAHDGDILDQGETLDQLGLVDGTVLTLERCEVVKIWTP
jgi:DUF4097 and DUF4098 domain-containing protein YvlB